MEKVILSVEYSTPYVKYESPETIMQHPCIEAAFCNIAELTEYLLTSIYEEVMMQGWSNTDSFHSHILGGFFHQAGGRYRVWESSTELKDEYGRITVHLPYFDFEFVEG